MLGTWSGRRWRDIHECKDAARCRDQDIVHAMSSGDERGGQHARALRGVMLVVISLLCDFCLAGILLRRGLFVWQAFCFVVLV